MSTSLVDLIFNFISKQQLPQVVHQTLESKLERMQILNHMRQVMDGHFSEEQQEDIQWFQCTILQEVTQVQVHLGSLPIIQFYSVLHGFKHQDSQKLCSIHQIASK